jgi:hypothetical protein
MRNTYKIIIALLMLLNIKYSKAQSPLYDLNWQKNTTYSDDFTGTSLNTTLWHALDCPSGDCCNWGGGTAFSNQNAYLSGGYLVLQVDSPAGYCFNSGNNVGIKTGGIHSQSEFFNYGYIEINAQLPGFIDGNGVAHADKFWPAFWSIHEITTPPCIHDEIDVMDECCSIYSDAKTTGSGWSHTDGSCGMSGPWQSHTNSTTLCNSYHKIAAEWNSDRIIFYFDDVPWFATVNDPTICTHAASIYIDEQINNATYPWYTGTPFPQYMKVDYFYYWTLNTTNCSSSLTILDNTALGNYYVRGTAGVRSDIIFGDGAHTISLSSGDHDVFRAVNTITINGELTVPSGAEFTAEPTPCN